MPRHANSQRTRRGRHLTPAPGTALLEVIVAITILTVAGLSAAVMANQSVAAVTQARDADNDTRRAGRFLDAVALWPRTDLDRHLGDRREGNWILTITRPYATLYVVALRTTGDSAHSAISRELVRTTIYRPESHDAP